MYTHPKFVILWVVLNFNASMSVSYCVSFTLRNSVLLSGEIKKCFNFIYMLKYLRSRVFIEILKLYMYIYSMPRAIKVGKNDLETIVKLYLK